MYVSISSPTPDPHNSLASPLQARWVFMTESVSELLGEPPHFPSMKSTQVHTGYEPHELVGTPSLDLVHPDEFRDVKSLH
jgi:hypothetical protein